ncbi:MAG: ATP-binding cassette domain-containing protein, partial [Vampirovibrionales bacterium]
LHKLADLTELPREPQGGLPLYNDDDPPPSISFDLKKLSFTYPDGGVPVFSNLSLGIPKESRVALVGPALAGKSTLLQLLAGNVQAQHGSLTINGHSINDVSKIKLRQCMAYLGSEPLLVEGSIKENLLMGLALDTAQQRERFNEILHATGLMEALARFPNGLQTPLVANGTNLPKSLRQLIVLTRTLLDVPSCLLLDEAFNDMDHVMKERAIRALYQYTPHTTVVCVTRHLGLISLCDYVYVFDAGELVTQGTPEGLWQQQHPYLQGLQGKGLQQYSHLKQPLPTSNDGGLSL